MKEITTSPHLITENFNLTIAPVAWECIIYVFVCVNLNMKREAFHTLLVAKVCAETVHS